MVTGIHVHIGQRLSIIRIRIALQNVKVKNLDEIEVTIEWKKSEHLRRTYKELTSSFIEF